MIKLGTDFSGIGSPEAALKKLGLKHESLFACEIDKHARKSFSAIHETKTLYEDITKRNHSEVEPLDLYVAGFPCQAFSMAGKRQGFEDTRGTLFFNVAEFIAINKPKVFVLENVKGLVSHENGKTFQTIVSVLSDNGGTVNGQMSVPYYDDGLGYHIYYKVLNTKEHGIPQNRERIFIVGFRDFTEYRFPAPVELKLKLKDMLEDDVDEKYYLSEEAINRLTNNGNGYHSEINEKLEEAKTILASDYKLARGMNVLRIKTNNAKGYEEAAPGDSINYNHLNSKTKRGRVQKQISSTIDTGAVVGVCIGSMRGRNPDNPSDRTPGAPTKQRLELNEDGVSNTLTSVQKDNLVVTNTIRRLTPLECWRLQGFTDEQFNKAKQVNSDTQLYKQAGNSITVNVMEALLKKIYK